MVHSFIQAQNLYRQLDWIDERAGFQKETDEQTILVKSPFGARLGRATSK